MAATKPVPVKCSTCGHTPRIRARVKVPYAYIRRAYGVNPIVGQHIKIDGKWGKIMRPAGDPHYLRVLMDGSKRPSNAHPTWHVDYNPTDPMILTVRGLTAEEEAAFWGRIKEAHGGSITVADDAMFDAPIEPTNPAYSD